MFSTNLNLIMKRILTLWIALAGIAASAEKRPNILLIFADDIGYEALNCYGGLDFETPHLNRMAKQGVRFSRAYTSPVCTPSRVSLHTGLYTTRHGHYDVLPVAQGTKEKVDFLKMPTFAQQIRANGYLTIVTGKWQLATLQHHPTHIKEAGFDSWCVWDIWRDGAKTERHWNPSFNQDGKVREDIAGLFGPDVLTEYVIQQMRAAKAAEKPFLIVHNELLPHWPVVETPDDKRLKREPSLNNFIHYMDILIGKLLDETEALGIRENTYVVFMGDNGTWENDVRNPKLGQPGEKAHTRHTIHGAVNGGKFQLNDAGCHVPLIVWGPSSIPANSVCDDLVDIVDLFPTFCELTNSKIPETLRHDGRSIVPQIHGKKGTLREWTHNALGKKQGGETLFDGEIRLFKNTGEALDARKLPFEEPADSNDDEVIQRKARLQQVFDKLLPDGPRPPVPFSP